MIDFHCHSTYSDGSDSVNKIFELALARGIRQLALTDHDTVAGVEELRRLCDDSSILCINGIEFSTRWKKHDIHIVGLHINPLHPEINNRIDLQQKCRLERAKDIADILENLGLSNCWIKVQKIAGHTHIARPHFAQLLVEEGWSATIQQAFSTYLSRGKPAYVVTNWMSIPEAIRDITASGGFAVLAHPLKYKLTHTKLCELIKHFKDNGGHALEVVSGDMQNKEVNELAELCEKYELYASSGSDYHGEKRSRVGLGAQRCIPEQCRPIWTLWEC